MAGSAAQVRKPGPPANPGPIGLFGFGMTTCSLMFVDTAWAESEFKDAVIGYALAYGGITQWVAGVMEMLKGNTFAATAFMSYGSFWIGWWYTGTMYKAGHFFSTSQYETGEALLLAQWGVFTLAFFIVTLHKRFPVKLKVVFGTLAVTFFLLSGGVFSDNCKKAAGYIGFLCGMSANYAAITDVVKEVILYVICTTDVTQAWAEDTPEVLEIAGSLDTEDPAGLPGTAGSGKGVIGSLAEGLRGRRKNHNDIV